MGLCDPKAVRKGTPWHQAVNQPGFITQAMKDHHARTHGHLPGQVKGAPPNPSFTGDNTYIEQHKPKE